MTAPMSISPSCNILVVTAGWSIPKAFAAAFPSGGSNLTRYAQRFDGVEINSTFFRSHRQSTYVRWRESVPNGFRFALKIPKLISHQKRLVAAGHDLEAFLSETKELGITRGPLLLQLPPKFGFDQSIAASFFALTRTLYDGDFVVEPRHTSWFDASVDQLLAANKIARVGADPPRADGGFAPGGFRGLSYVRLHGSPRVYFSSYGAERLAEITTLLLNQPGPCWCVFDNTASGAAAANALQLVQMLSA